MIKLLIFDAGSLLWESSAIKTQMRMEAFFRKYGIDGKVIDSRWKRIFEDVNTGRIKYDQAVRIEFEGMGLGKKALDEWTRIHTKDLLGDHVLNPYVRPTLRRLKKLYKIAILTDEVRDLDFKVRVCRRLGVNFFDAIFCSSEIGYAKPHRESYFTVLRHFKVSPKEAVFVGHSKDELDGSMRYGINTIAIGWDRGSKANYYIKRFSEIPAIVKSI
jgi:HAD superfamily hydrolase (TIGR01549 family)